MMLIPRTETSCPSINTVVLLATMPLCNRTVTMCDQSPCPPPHPPKRSSSCRAKGANEGVREVICSGATVVFGENFIKGWKHCFRDVILFTNGTWLWGKAHQSKKWCYCSGGRSYLMVLVQWLSQLLNGVSAVVVAVT